MKTQYHAPRSVPVVMRDFFQLSAIPGISAVNFLLAFLWAKRNRCLSKVSHARVLIPMTLFPILIVALGFALMGLPFDANRSSLTPRAWPIYGLYAGNLVYACRLTYNFKGVRW